MFFDLADQLFFINLFDPKRFNPEFRKFGDIQKLNGTIIVLEHFLTTNWPI